MSKIQDKITSFFNNLSIKLSKSPANHHLHIYADYVEIVALFSNSNYVTTNDILDRFKDDGILQQTKNDSDQAQENDRNEAFVNSIFDLLIFRKSHFEQDYPFEVLTDRKIKLLPISEIFPNHKLYIYLLISSNLNYFSIFEPELTTEFESLCYTVIANYLPKSAIVKSFGKNSTYTGSAIDKIKKLAVDLKIEINEKILNNQIVAGNQERGLDVIGWIPFKDYIPNFTVFMGQCACGKEWYKKLSETKRFEKYYNFYDISPIHTLFIPYSLLSNSGTDFYHGDEFVNKNLIFERGRLLHNLQDFSFFDAFESKLIVEKCIEVEEDIV